MSQQLELGNGSMEALLGQVADEFTDQINRGEQPDVEDYARRYPEMAAILRQVLPALQVMGPGSPPVEPRRAQTATEVMVSGCLGDFRLIREVGRGGMGVVYEAEQISLGRRVALKVLPFAATMDPRLLQRFHNEARAAAGLHHTNIVPVHGVGCERGVHYYAMQFIEGHTLADLIAQQKGASSSQVPTMDAAEAEAAATSAPTVPRAAQATSVAPRDGAYFRQAAEWGIQAAEALDCAHTLGVVHRDVKPANLMVDATGRLWVTDFGLAQVQSDVRLTITGDLVGTLRYMSPEQALAKRVVVDHRTDVYSLGATLYELLTLEPAYTGGDRQELLRQIAFEEPKPPRRINRTIPVELETIVLKALEKNPADRYATAKELADDLRLFLEDKAIRAKRPTLRQRAGKWARRHRGMVAGGIVLMVLAVVVLGISIVVVGWSLHEKNEALAMEKLRKREMTVALQAAQEMRTRSEGDFRGSLRTMNEILSSVEELGPDQSPTAGRVREAVRKKVLAFYRDSLYPDIPQSSPAKEEVAWAHIWMGNLCARQGEFASAVKAYNAGYVLFQELIISGQGTAYRLEERPTIEKAYREALRLCREGAPAEFATIRQDYRYQRFLSQQNKVASTADDPEEARKTWRQELALAEVLAADHPQRTWAVNALAQVYARRTTQLEAVGRHDEVVEVCLSAVKAYERVIAPPDPPVRPSLGLDDGSNDAENLGKDLTECLSQNRRFAEAARVCKLEAAYLERVQAEYPDGLSSREALAKCLCRLGACLAEIGQSRDAEETFRMAIAQYQVLWDSKQRSYFNSQAFAMSCNDLGNILQSAGRFDDAESAYKKALAIIDELLEFSKVNRERKWITYCEQDLNLLHKNLDKALLAKRFDAKLSGVLASKVEPADVGERLALAQICQLPCKSLYAAAVRFYADTFAEQPTLADDLQHQPRYNAACAAALAGCARGKDAGGLPDKDYVRFRTQALKWLRDDLAAWHKVLEQNADKARPAVAQQLAHWLEDTDFAGVRGIEALARLPETEHQEWQKLWADVADTLSRAAGKTDPEKKAAPK